MEKADVKYLPLAAVGMAQGGWNYYVRPELSARRAWLGLGALILAYELAAPKGELLSEGVDRALDRHSFLTTAAIGITALHLMNRLPPQIDPFKHAIDFLRT